LTPVVFTPPGRPEVNATSLSFFLVMPVQRIARYPLLLQTIRKHTEPDHPAYARLEEAAHTAIALNWRINEYKRFREVGKKAVRPLCVPARQCVTSTKVVTACRGE